LSRASRGRPPGKRKGASLSIRLAAELRRCLDEVARASERSVSDEAALRLERSLEREPRLITRIIVEAASE